MVTRRVRLVVASVAIAAVLASTAIAAQTASAHPWAPTTFPGEYRPSVWCIKTAMNTIARSGLWVDYKYDQSAVNTVKNFQQFFGLWRDGIVGKQTGSVMWYIFDRVNQQQRTNVRWMNTGPPGLGMSCYHLVPSTH